MKTIALSPKFSIDVVLIWSVIGVAWAILFLMGTTGHVHFLHYSIFQESFVSLLLKLLLFLLSCQVMTIAMMLPSSLPFIRLFAKVVQKQDSDTHFSILFVFLLAYLAIWTGYCCHCVFSCIRGAFSAKFWVWFAATSDYCCDSCSSRTISV